MANGPDGLGLATTGAAWRLCRQGCRVQPSSRDADHLAHSGSVRQKSRTGTHTVRVREPSGRLVSRRAREPVVLMPSWDTLRLFLHVLAATVWVGGQVTLAALVPTLRRLGTDMPKVAARQFNRIAWPAFAVLIATGVWNVFADRDKVSGEYRTTLVVKVVVVAVSVRRRLCTLARAAGRGWPSLARSRVSAPWPRCCWECCLPVEDAGRHSGRMRPRRCPRTASAVGAARPGCPHADVQAGIGI
jgi:hypothetical protein